MTGAACDEIRAAAPELALGVLDGEERARVLDHVSACPSCRTHLAELAVVAGEVLAAAPAHEPPPGFESRVLDAVRGIEARTSPRRRRWRPLLAAVTAALLGAGVAVLVTLSATREERDLGAQYGAVLARAGGDYFAVAELRDDAGERGGIVFGYQGEPPWLTLVLDAGTAEPRYRVSIAIRGGGERELGSFVPARDGRTWAHVLPVPVHEVSIVHLRGAAGGSLSARIPVQGR